MSEQPPPYVPLPSFPSAFSSPPAAFPGSPYQTYPQSYSGGGDHAYYQGPPGPYLTQPAGPGYHSGPPGTSRPWDAPTMYGELPKHTVFVVEQGHGGGGGGGGGGGSKYPCLAACSTALCCCCLWDMLTKNH